ncbi:uracil-DNA glycosylase [Rhodobacteraceae bacterium RKSG542]|uniref:uracil-DNA glycosylase n=1 Tax=Pseudovibrio flavus TaxID=2529854 RepID=UPI0012BD044F|nr:uracil-DNA glycosylase [Pseudovibrio flavus]MTI17393.1 uracil-DNA glycosylase [Pseudovibrio flavus]
MKRAQPDWHNAPVANFGPANAQLLVVGLAPGLKGGNRTGIPFQGDFSGELLSRALVENGFASYLDCQEPSLGIEPTNVMITNVVRCLPPDNKPNGVEVQNCLPFLGKTLSQCYRLRAVVAIGRVAYDNTLKSYGISVRAEPFAHNKQVVLPDGRQLFATYHCSRYNVNTGRITEEEFCGVFKDVAGYLQSLVNG